MSKPIKVAVIYGSVRNGRLCDAVAGWVADRVEARADYTLDVIDPLAEGLTDLRGTDGATEKAIAARLSRADAFIVVTPEYNHSFPAALKHFIDGFNEPWHPNRASSPTASLRGQPPVEQLPDIPELTPPPSVRCQLPQRGPTPAPLADMNGGPP